MNMQKIFVPALAAVGVVVGWQQWGWPGVALAVGALVMWVLLHFTRTMQVLRRAANRPLGYVDSAVMLNARLQTGMALLQVIGLARALGQQISAADADPEIYRWRDASDSYVETRFRKGKLAEWQLVRPPQEPASETPAAAAAVPPASGAES